MIWLLFLVCLSEAVIVRIPVDYTQDRSHVWSYHGISAQKFIRDQGGYAYLASVDYPANLEVYEPVLDWGDYSCIEIESMYEIPRDGIWLHRTTGPRTARIKNAKSMVDEILRLKDIYSINPCQPVEHHRHWYDAPISLYQASTYRQLQNWANRNNLSGKNFTVMVSDTGITYTHLQFGGTIKKPFFDVLDGSAFTKQPSANPRILANFLVRHWLQDADEYSISCFQYDKQTHGTHVSGIIAGQRGSVGLAGKSKIVMLTHMYLDSEPGEKCKFGGMSGVSTSILQSILDAGYDPVVINNSWGSTTTNYDYNSNSVSLDDFTYQNPRPLVLYSAGNDGETGYNSYTRSHNILSVGSVEDNQVMSGFSSGRDSNNLQAMVVHVTTIGGAVLSANALDYVGYTLKSGTSMAVAVASGIGVLIADWYRIQGIEVDSRLLRASLIHVAIPVNGIPKGKQGFGFLQPSLLTDYGPVNASLYHLDAITNKTRIVMRTAQEDENFRISASWLTPESPDVENIAGLVCLKNGQQFYNRTDQYNTMIQVNMHLFQGDLVICDLIFVRAANSSSGFDVAIVYGGWSRGLLHIKPDVSEPVPLSFYGNMLLGQQQTLGVNESKLLVKSTIFYTWARYVFMLNPLWIPFWFLFGMLMGCLIFHAEELFMYVKYKISRKEKTNKEA